MPARKPSALDPATAQAFEAWLLQGNRSPSTAAQYVTFIRRAYAELPSLEDTAVVEARVAAWPTASRGVFYSAWRMWKQFREGTAIVPPEPTKADIARVEEALHREFQLAFAAPNPEPPDGQVYGAEDRRALMVDSFGWDIEKACFGFLGYPPNFIYNARDGAIPFPWIVSYPGLAAQRLLRELVFHFSPEFPREGWVSLRQMRPDMGGLGWALQLPSGYGAVRLHQLVQRAVRMKHGQPYPPLGVNERRARRAGQPISSIEPTEEYIAALRRSSAMPDPIPSRQREVQQEIAAELASDVPWYAPRKQEPLLERGPSGAEPPLDPMTGQLPDGTQWRPPTGDEG